MNNSHCCSEGLIELDGLGEAEIEELGDRLDEILELGDTLGLIDPLGLNEGLTELDGLTELEGEGLALIEPDGL